MSGASPALQFRRHQCSEIAMIRGVCWSRRAQGLALGGHAQEQEDHRALGGVHGGGLAHRVPFQSPGRCQSPPPSHSMRALGSMPHAHRARALMVGAFAEPGPLPLWFPPRWDISLDSTARGGPSAQGALCFPGRPCPYISVSKLWFTPTFYNLVLSSASGCSPKPALSLTPSPPTSVLLGCSQSCISSGLWEVSAHKPPRGRQA